MRISLSTQRIWKITDFILPFCNNDNGAFRFDSKYFAMGNDIEFLCMVLNSPMEHNLLKDAYKRGTGYLLISVQAVGPVKIPVITNKQNLEFEKGSKRIGLL